MRNIIHHIIKSEAVTRPALASAMGVSTGTITNIVNELIDNGVVYEGHAENVLRGRKAKYLHFNSKLRYIVTVNIPDSSPLTISICDLLGNVLAQADADVDLHLTERNPDHFIVRGLVTAVADFISVQSQDIRDKLSVTALSVPGILNKNQTLYVPHFGWHNLPLEKPLQAAVGMPVYFQNVTRAEAIYEMRYVDKCDKNIIYLTVSPGLGIAHFYDGRLIQGKSGMSGEAGHMTMKTDGELCFCGNSGCAELYCSGGALLKKGANLLSGNRDDILCDIIDKSGGALTIEHMFTAMHAGSIKVHMLFAEYARNLGTFLANIINCFDPDKIITNRELFEYDDFIYNMALEEARSRIVNRFARDVPITLGRLKASEPEKAICASVLDIVLDMILNKTVSADPKI